ncbi:reverse transcriptase domain-containing protein [Tanacetum coccineum]
MVLIMITRNAGQCTATTQGGWTSEQDGREGERSGDQAGSGRNGRGGQGCGQNGQESDQGSQGSSQDNGENGGGGGVPDFATIIAQQLQNPLPTIISQVGNHVNNKNQDNNVINDNDQGNVRTMNNGRGGCSYKEFMACNLKDYDGKGGAIVYTRWIEKMESVQDMSGCGENQKVKYTAGSLITRKRKFCPNNEMQKLETKFWYHAMVGAGHAAYTDRFHELARLVPHLVTPENKRIKRYIYGLAPPIRAMVAATEPTTIQSDVLKAGMQIDEAIKNGALKKISEKKGNNEDLSRDGNARDDNKSSRGNGANGGGGVLDFATIIAQQLQNQLPTIIAQVGNHVNNQGNNKNQDDKVTNDNNPGNVRTMNYGRGDCSYKEFMACNPKKYDGKGGAIVQTRGREAVVGITWEDFKTLTREEFCPNNEMQKLETEFWCRVMVGAGQPAYTNRFQELARLVPHLVTPKNKRIERYIYGLAPPIRVMVAATEPTIIQSVVLKD